MRVPVDTANMRGGAGVRTGAGDSTPASVAGSAMNAARHDDAHVCGLCGSTSLSLLFSESDGHATHQCWRCRVCHVSQTVGERAPLSPDYVDLRAEDLSDDHRFVQGRGKARAFSQWQAVLAERGMTRGTLLDIGCGVGGFLDFAAASGFDVYGYDASKAQADDARTRHPRVRAAATIASYETSLETPLPPFDAVTLWDVFEHIRSPHALLREIRQRMASTGLLFLSVPGGGPIPAKVRLARLRRRTPGLIPWEHVFYYEPRSLERVMGANGFTIVEAGGVVPYVRARGPTELVRRMLHRCLANTRFALQLFVLAQPQP